MADIFNGTEFISRISDLAKNKGISVNKALSDCGFKDLIVNIRKGSVPSVDKFIILANYFDVDIGWLLNGAEGNSSKEPPRETLTEEETLLLKNYRDLSDKQKDEIQGRTARLAVNAGDKKLLTSPKREKGSDLDFEIGKIG